MSGGEATATFGPLFSLSPFSFLSPETSFHFILVYIGLSEDNNEQVSQRLYAQQESKLDLHTSY